MNNQSKENFETIYLVGYSNDDEERFQASSGGIGTAITKFLLSKKEYSTCITFIFNEKKCMYIPKLIHDIHDLNTCGSIYQEIDIYKFLKENLDEIQDGIIVSCPPCQVVPIRNLLKKEKIQNFIISFSCSGQTIIDGSWKYYQFLNIKKSNVSSIQYRGNGWPNGITIKEKDGNELFYENYTEPWVTIHRSQLYRPIKCLYCKRHEGNFADISLADPWIEKYIKNDNIGSTLINVFTEKGMQAIDEANCRKIIFTKESSYQDYCKAQKPNIEKETRIKRSIKFIRVFTKLRNNKIYFAWATKSLYNMRLHIKIMMFLNKLLRE